MLRGNIHTGRPEGANVVDELSRIVRDIEGESEMSTDKLQELQEMAARLLALSRKLPRGQQRHDIVQQIRRFRGQIAALKGPDLGRPHRGPKAKVK
jgi:hypothetical protein